MLVLYDILALKISTLKCCDEGVFIPPLACGPAAAFRDCHELDHKLQEAEPRLPLTLGHIPPCRPAFYLAWSHGILLLRLLQVDRTRRCAFGV